MKLTNKESYPRCNYLYCHRNENTGTSLQAHIFSAKKTLGRRCLSLAQWRGICLQYRRHSLYSWVRKIAQRRKWQPTLVFLPGKFHGQRNLGGYSPWGLKESDTTEHGPVVHHHHEESTAGLTKGWGQGKTEADTSADKEENGNQDLNWRKTALSIVSIIKGGFSCSQEDSLTQ